MKKKYTLPINLDLSIFVYFYYQRSVYDKIKDDVNVTTCCLNKNEAADGSAITQKCFYCNVLCAACLKVLYFIVKVKK